jgi:hypothetical protein
MLPAVEVIESMITNGMTLFNNPSEYIRMLPDVIANAKESSFSRKCSKGFEYKLGGPIYRAVIKRNI